MYTIWSVQNEDRAQINTSKQSTNALCGCLKNGIISLLEAAEDGNNWKRVYYHCWRARPSCARKHLGGVCSRCQFRRCRTSPLLTPNHLSPGHQLITANQQRECGKPFYMIIVGYQKDFDSVATTAVMKASEERGLGKEYLQLQYEMYISSNQTAQQNSVRNRSKAEPKFLGSVVEGMCCGNQYGKEGALKQMEYLFQI